MVRWTDNSLELCPYRRLIRHQKTSMTGRILIDWSRLCRFEGFIMSRNLLFMELHSLIRILQQFQRGFSRQISTTAHPMEHAHVRKSIAT
jgi:hypothetical protein